MRWEIIDNTPRVGDTRLVTRFAWLPTTVLSKLTMTDHRIWLELYLEEQVFKVDNSWSGLETGWKTVAKTIHI